MNHHAGRPEESESEQADRGWRHTADQIFFHIALAFGDRHRHHLGAVAHCERTEITIDAEGPRADARRTLEERGRRHLRSDTTQLRQLVEEIERWHRRKTVRTNRNRHT